MANLKKLLFLVLVIFSAYILTGCGSAPGGDVVVDDNVVVSEIKLTTNTSQLNYNESTEIKVYIYTQSGALYPGEKSVVFSLDNPSLADLSPTVLTVSGGVGKATLKARDLKGNITITAMVDDVTYQMAMSISDAPAPASIELTASPETVYVGGTSSITASLKDTNGNNVEDGTIVTFDISSATLGTVTKSASTKDGIALATFSADNTSGFAIITARVGTLSKNINIEVKDAEVNSIVFNEANPQILPLYGTGQTNTSTVSFTVLDSNGQPVNKAVEVLMTLNSPGGGEYIGAVPGTTSLKVNTVDGIASVILTSGSVPGTVTVTAQIADTDVKTSSGIIAIGGGVPSASRFSISTSRFNYEGLIYDGVEGDINVLLADRYGNTNILANTAVKFFSECGGVEPAVVLDAEGKGTVKFRTQRPTPYLVSPDPNSTDATIEAEYSYLTWFDSIFKTNYADSLSPEAPNPRDGFCTITAVVDGEEEFNDINGNGEYDLGEPFTDSFNDVFEDADDNYNYSLNTLYRYDEWSNSYINYSEKLISESEFSKDGQFDGMNGQWDSNKKIYKKINLVMSGYPRIYYYIRNNQNQFLWANHENPKTIALSHGQTATLYLLVADDNLNAPIGGTKVDVSASVTDSGAISLQGDDTSYTFPDVGGFNYNVLTYTISSEYTYDDNTTKTCLVAVSPKVTYNYGGGTLNIADSIYLTAPCEPGGN